MLKSTGIIRRIDGLGRLPLPAEARRIFDIEEKDALEILVDEKKEHIVLRKKTKMCIKCKSTYNLKQIKPGYYICNDCIKQLN